MNYCTFCGTPVECGSVFCSSCGHQIDPHPSQPAAHVRPKSKCAIMKNKLCCELAYTGVLFWLPLVACPGEEHTLYHANQGLWLLILSVAACISIRLLSIVNELLAGTLLGVVCGGVYSLLFIAFMLGMLFLLWSAVTRAIAIHQGKEVKPILFFEEVSIIHSKRVGEC